MGKLLRFSGFQSKKFWSFIVSLVSIILLSIYGTFLGVASEVISTAISTVGIISGAYIGIQGGTELVHELKNSEGEK